MKNIFKLFALPLLFVFGISSAYATTTPVLIGSVAVPGGMDSQQIFISGNYAYATVNSDLLQIFDITNPASPAALGSYNTPGMALDVAVSGNYAYVADNTSGLQIIDISNPALPTLAATVSAGTIGSARRVVIAGNYAYVANSAGLKILDITNPLSPILSGSYSASTRNVFMNNGLAYIDDGTTLRILDISNPASIVLKGSYSVGDSIDSFAVSGNYLYVGSYSETSPKILILNISNIAAPTLAGSYTQNIVMPLNIQVEGNYLHVAGATGGHLILDITNPESPVFFGQYNGGSQDFFARNNYVYLTGSTIKIIFIDTAAPTAFAPTITSPTNDTTPALTFSATDNIGVSSYQVKVDSGDFSTQTSPYSLPTLSEGTRTITVRAYDVAGNYTDGTATVVIDLTAPVITLNGDSKITLPVGSTYTDAGATATDNMDGNITSSIVKTGTVDTSKEGSYFIKYNVTDTAGNAAAEVKRLVVIKPVAAIIKDLNKNIKADSKVVEKVKGGILLQIQGRGEMWYVNPKDGRKYSLGKPDDAFAIIKKLGIGISNANLAKIPRNGTKDKGDQAMMDKVKGKIVIKVQGKGEAWYVHPITGKRYLLGTPSDAFKVLEKLGKGITNANLNKVPVGLAVR